MRTSTFARAGAIVTATALAVSLSGGPVSAAETGVVAATAATTKTSPASASSYTAGPVSATAVATGPATFDSGVITQDATTRYLGTANYSGPGPAAAVVTVNGTPRGTVPVLFSATAPGRIAVDIPRVWGSGKVQVTTDGFVSNVFYARKLVTSTRSDNYPLKVNRRNSKVTFRARNVKIVDPSSGQFKSLRRVKLQRSKGGKWRTIKTIRLNSSGNGKYTKSGKAKYRYRLYSSQTSRQTQFRTLRTGRI